MSSHEVRGDILMQIITSWTREAYNLKQDHTRNAARLPATWEIYWSAVQIWAQCPLDSNNYPLHPSFPNSRVSRKRGPLPSLLEFCRVGNVNTVLGSLTYIKPRLGRWFEAQTGRRPHFIFYRSDDWPDFVKSEREDKAWADMYEAVMKDKANLLSGMKILPPPFYPDDLPLPPVKKAPQGSCTRTLEEEEQQEGWTPSYPRAGDRC